MSNDDLEVLIRTGCNDPVAVALAKALLTEAGIPYFEMNQHIAPRQESGNFVGWWDLRVPREREAEAREIIQTIEAMK